MGAVADEDDAMASLSAYDRAERHQVNEGPGMAWDAWDGAGTRVTKFDANRPPTYPAFQFYEFATDDLLWIESDDPFTLHVARASRYLLSPHAAAILSRDYGFQTLAEESADWANLLADKLRSRHIAILPPEDVPDGARMGYQASINGVVTTTRQMHVDWRGQTANADDCLTALADAVDVRMEMSRSLKSVPLHCPERGCEATPLASGNLKIRAVRAIFLTRHGDDAVSIFPITRVDVLFGSAP
jgi:hypothetical protein